VLAGAALLAAAALLAGCGGASSNTDTVPAGTTLTIYSSLPFAGPQRQQALDVRDAELLALRQHHDQVGKYGIRYISLDDSTAKKGGWEPDATSANARTAAQDRTTIAYLGDLDSGATAISLPVLNAVGTLQVSPASPTVGLTQGGVGADKGEPDKYYPTATRTFGRVMPNDTAQGTALAQYMSDKGCTELYVLHDIELYDGGGLAQVAAAQASAKGVEPVGDGVLGLGGPKLSKLIAQIKSSGADCVLFSVVAADRPAAAMNAVHQAIPGAKLFGPSQLVDERFTSTLHPATQAATFLASPVAPPAEQSAAARRFAAQFAAAYQHQPAADAVFGYVAMNAVLQAIADAGSKGDDRRAVIKAFLNLRDQPSPVGTYSIDRRGDTTLNTFAGYQIRDGRPVADPQFTSAS
jgi:branched-chain amino acid transport system substrate-binding protein